MKLGRADKLLQKYIWENFEVQRGITPKKFRGSTFPEFHETW
jgi:hypothetical protein